MFIDARALVEGTTLEADVCVAGAGAAGIAIALDLQGSGLSVLLLESGGQQHVEDIQVLSEGKMLGIDTWDLRARRVRALGGTTGHWAGWCRPLLPQDFEQRDYVALSGWPIRYSDLVPWYRRACETLEIGEFTWNAGDRAKAMGTPLLPLRANVEHRYYQLSPPTRFGRRYVDALTGAADVRVVTFANLKDIRLNQQRGSVESFACRTMEGTTFRVQASRYVLALGGVENARVLLASRSQQREGVANGHDVVGRYFMEHPHYFNSVGLVHPPSLDLTFYERRASDLQRPDGTPVTVLGALGLSAEVSKKERLLNFTATLQATGGRVGGGGRQGTAPPAPAIMSEKDAVPPSVMQQVLMRAKGGTSSMALTIRSEQSPYRESRVTLSDDLDPLGMPRVALDWRIAPEDDTTMRRAMVILSQEFAAAGLGRGRVPGNATRFIWRQEGGGHHMGTTRMGTNPRTSVVNAASRAHEVDNLYITGGSVFTTGGDSNPTLTIVALAHRLADTLKRTMKPSAKEKA